MVDSQKCSDAGERGQERGQKEPLRSQCHRFSGSGE